MSSRGGVAAVGIIVGLVSFVILGGFELLLIELLFGGDSSNGFGFPFILLGAGMILIPANIVAAALIGKRVSEEQRRLLALRNGRCSRVSSRYDAAKLDIDVMTESELIDLNHRIVARLRFLRQMTRTRPCSSSESANGSNSIPTGGHR
jgi:hypothetical protein